MAIHGDLRERQRQREGSLDRWSMDEDDNEGKIVALLGVCVAVGVHRAWAHM
jgi:hypothetical protein